jgi:hypothetical protein
MNAHIKNKIKHAFKRFPIFSFIYPPWFKTKMVRVEGLEPPWN